MVYELNSFFHLGLAVNIDLSHSAVEPGSVRKPDILMIGSSHIFREGELLANRGYSVVLCGKPGWRANKWTAGEMESKVVQALEGITSDDVIIIQMLDNTIYMSRTEEGGDLPIRQYGDGSYHVDGEVILAGKERQHLLFKGILPILKHLANRKCVFVTAMPRYICAGCCEDPEHVVNREDEDFEEDLRENLQECRGNFKDFLFCNGLRNFRVIDPSPVLQHMPLDEVEQNWDADPVHPTEAGYSRICDLLEGEIEKLVAGVSARKREGGQLRPQRAKRLRGGSSWMDKCCILKRGQNRHPA